MPLTRGLSHEEASPNVEGKAMVEGIGASAWPTRSWRAAAWVAITAVMILPILTTRLAADTAGDRGDFIFLAVLVAGAGLAFELAARVSGPRAYRVAIAMALAAGLGQIWINLAVGIVGSENEPMNLIYAGVVAVAAGGAALARLEPFGMARAMVAAAVAQAMAFAIVLIAASSFTGPITGFLVTLWLASAWLFRKAGDQATEPVRTSSR